jgi:hypothetical protein
VSEVGRFLDLEYLPEGGVMSTLDVPGPFDGADESGLTSEERALRFQKWFDAKLAESLAKRGPLVPGVDCSEVKACDVLGDADVRGLRGSGREREGLGRGSDDEGQVAE